MTQASLTAYFDQENNAKRVSKKENILQAIKQTPMCIDQIAVFCAIPYAEVCKRTNDLLDEGLIYISDHDHDYKQSVFRATSPDRIEIAKKFRHARKYHAWLKRGLTEFEGYLPESLKAEIEAIFGAES
jgi:predicted transcriptional regulator